jgi:hypothetical protein
MSPADQARRLPKSRLGNVTGALRMDDLLACMRVKLGDVGQHILTNHDVKLGLSFLDPRGADITLEAIFTSMAVAPGGRSSCGDMPIRCEMAAKLENMRASAVYKARGIRLRKLPIRIAKLPKRPYPTTPSVPMAPVGKSITYRVKATH